MTTREEIIALCATNPEVVADMLLTLQASNLKLLERMQALEERLNKNSQNSDKPPSSDGLRKRPRKPKPIRNSKKRKQGGQQGHAGSTLKISSDVDHVVRHAVDQCQQCGHNLAQIDGRVVQQRQVLDIPPPRIVRTEHQLVARVCPCCQTSNNGQLPADLKGTVQYGPRLRALVVYLMIYQLLPYKRTQEVLKTLYAVKPSTGTLNRILQDGYKQLEEAEKAIREAIIQAKVVHCDETGHRVGAKTRWLHVASTKLLTFYHSNKARGSLAHQAADVLPDYKGIAVHDFYRSYLILSCQHGLCNAHLLRELKAVIEREPHQLWAKAVVRLLQTANRLVKAAKAQDKWSLSAPAQKRIVTIYDRLLRQADTLNPLAAPNGRRGRTKQTKTRNLVSRLLQYKQDILRFTYDFNVPFDNNLAERDLRMVKVQQKISNCFRSELGAKIFCRIRGYISTCLKQEYELFPVLANVMQGNVFIPIPAE